MQLNTFPPMDSNRNAQESECASLCLYVWMTCGSKQKAKQSEPRIPSVFIVMVYKGYDNMGLGLFTQGLVADHDFAFDQQSNLGC